MSRKKILLVEDETVLALDIQRTLEADGHKVIAVVSSGDEAFQVISEKVPDLVLMDIHLEGKVDGYETAESIKNLAKIPIIFFSGSPNKKYRDLIVGNPYYHFLSKPFRSDELLSLIHSLP